MNRARRDRRRAAEVTRGAHTGAEHRRVEDPDHPGHLLPAYCGKCRPGSKTWDRSLSGKAT